MHTKNKNRRNNIDKCSAYISGKLTVDQEYFGVTKVTWVKCLRSSSTWQHTKLKYLRYYPDLIQDIIKYNIQILIPRYSSFSALRVYA